MDRAARARWWSRSRCVAVAAETTVTGQIAPVGVLVRQQVLGSAGGAAELPHGGRDGARVVRRRRAVEKVLRRLGADEHGNEPVPEQAHDAGAGQHAHRGALGDRGGRRPDLGERHLVGRVEQDHAGDRAGIGLAQLTRDQRADGVGDHHVGAALPRGAKGLDDLRRGDLGVPVAVGGRAPAVPRAVVAADGQRPGELALKVGPGHARLAEARLQQDSR